MATDYSALGLIVFIGFGFIISMLSIKYIIFNMKLMFRTLIWKKHNIGLIFIRNLGNSFNLPDIVRIADNKSESKEEIKVFSREQFKEGTWFGFPYIICDAEDMKTSLGLYQKIKNKVTGKEKNINYKYCEVITDKEGSKTYNPIEYKEFHLLKAQCDNEGHPEYHLIPAGKSDTGEQLYYNTKIPKLDAVKTSVSISPHLMKTVIAGAALNAAVKDFLDKNKYILYAACGAAILSAGALFFSYNNQNSIAQFCGEQLTQKTASVIDMCHNAIVNISSR